MKCFPGPYGPGFVFRPSLAALFTRILVANSGVEVFSRRGRGDETVELPIGNAEIGIAATAFERDIKCSRVGVVVGGPNNRGVRKFHPPRSIGFGCYAARACRSVSPR